VGYNPPLRQRPLNHPKPSAIGKHPGQIKHPSISGMIFAFDGLNKQPFCWACYRQSAR